MTWTRVKRWIGRHPVWAVSLATFAWLLAAKVAVCVMAILVNRFRLPINPGLWFLVLSAAGLALGVAGSTCLIACLRGKAGLSMMSVLPGICWAPLVCLLTVAVLMTVGLAVSGVNVATAVHDRGYQRMVGLVFLVGWVIVTFSQTFGLVAAAWITRWQIRRGRWEVTIPVDYPKEHP